LARYFCDFVQGSTRLEDADGFRAKSDADAIELLHGIAAVMMDGDPQAGETMVYLRSETGQIIFSSSLQALVYPLS